MRGAMTAVVPGRRRVACAAPWTGALGLTLALVALYTAVTWHTFPASATDVGGDYAYDSWQLQRGATLYGDVLGQQTPGLYLLGAAVYHLWPRAEVFLAFALVVRAATVVGVLALARACGFTAVSAAMACVVYLLLPMGFLFDARFEPNILITLGGVLCTLLLTRLSVRRALLAGAGCAVFILAKLTFVPIALALAAYLLLTRRALAGPFGLAAVGTLLVATGLGYFVIGGTYIDGAYLAHVGSTLSWQNFAATLRYVWNVEGLTALTALAGAVFAARDDGPCRLLAFYLVGGLLTLGAAISVGSLAPEMLAGEPAIALCAIVVLRRALVAWRQGRTTRPLYACFGMAFAVLLIVGQVLEARDDAVAVTSARPSPGLACTERLLAGAIPVALPVIAPPYAAFLAQRHLALGLSDTFNWTIRVRRGDSVARVQADRVVALLHDRGIGLVMIDDDHPLPPRVERAVDEYYVPAPSCAGIRLYRPPLARRRAR